MPHLRIETNVARANVPKDLAKQLCSVISTSLGKPLNVNFSIFVVLVNKFMLK